MYNGEYTKNRANGVNCETVKSNVKAKCCIVYLAYALFTLTLGYFVKDMLTLKIFGLLAALHMLFSVIAIIRMQSSKSVISLSIVLFLYVFNLGQLFLKTFFSDYVFTKLDLLEVYGLEAFAESSMYSVLIITFVVAGILLCSKKGATKSVAKVEKYSFNKGKMKSLGFFIVVTSAAVNLIIFYQQLTAAMSGAYETASSVQGSGILSLYSNFLLLGVGTLMLAYSDKKFAVNIIYFLTVTFYAVMMITGQRGKYVIIIVALSILYFKLTGITVLKGVVFALLVYLGLALLNLISIVRNEEIITLEVIFQNIRNVRYPLLSCIEEFGASQYTLELTMSKVPHSVDYLYGYSYVVNLIRLFPNVTGVFTDLLNSSIYYASYHTQSMGGSIIGEFYANFGWLGFIAAFVFGYAVGALANRFELSAATKKDLRTPIYLFAFAFIMWWIRDSVGTLANVILAAIFMFVLIFVLRSFSGNEKDTRSNR